MFSPWLHLSCEVARHFNRTAWRIGNVGHDQLESQGWFGPADEEPMTAQLQKLAERYAAAWCSQNASSVASCYSPYGSLSVNGGPPAVGRDAIAGVARGFMTDFPDMTVSKDGLSVQGDRTVFRWTLAGTNTGPGGTGKRVRISGYEEWRIGADGLIAESCG
jgi:hypothetical protein